MGIPEILLDGFLFGLSAFKGYALVRTVLVLCHANLADSAFVLLNGGLVQDGTIEPNQYRAARRTVHHVLKDWVIS